MITYFIIVNIIAENNIIGTVIDIHPNQIKFFNQSPEGKTVVFFRDGRIHVIDIPFMDFYELQQAIGANIDDTYEDEVRDYLKDNFKNVRRGNNGKTN